jgi:hypothetical protein
MTDEKTREGWRHEVRDSLPKRVESGKREKRSDKALLLDDPSFWMMMMMMMMMMKAFQITNQSSYQILVTRLAWKNFQFTQCLLKCVKKMYVGPLNRQFCSMWTEIKL